MKISPICPSCLLSRVYYEAKLVTGDEYKISKCVEESLKLLAENYPKKPVNAHLATKIHRRVYQILGVDDPYREVKKEANETASKFLPVAQKIVEESEDRFKAALIVSIIGNNFDYGVMGHRVAKTDFESYFREKLKAGLKIDDTDRIKNLCRGRVVYLTDNAGEIFFDVLLMKEIKKICKSLTVVVRGRPIISDATVEDAKLAGVDKVADELLTNGGGAIGVMVEELPEETFLRLKEADILVAKGMANYECLSEGDFRPVAFLLTAKCKPVARDIGVEVGDMVAMVIE